MDKNLVCSLLVSGVGGQGVLVATDIIAEVAGRAGMDAKKSEVHGVAQRGGPVVSHVRFGKKVYSPLGKIGDIDFLVALERLEALRYAHWVKPSGSIIVNDQRIMPTLFPGDKRSYPEGIIEFLKKKHPSLIVVPAYKMALELGNIRVINIIMCGALSKFLKFDEKVWQAVIAQHVPPKFVDLNLQAFKRGQEIISK